MRILTALAFLCWMSDVSAAQLLHEGKTKSFTRADSLRGMLTPLRTCYDLTYYHLDVRIDPSTKTVAGTNTVRFRAEEDFDRMQLDLFENMKIERITLDDGGQVAFEREFGAVFLNMPSTIEKHSVRSVTVQYSGAPIVAKRPPWDGGFIWTQDKEGNPWVAVACQGTGASLWWPTKDHQADEPDSMLISVTVPPGLQNVSNGRLRNVTTLSDGWVKYDWFVSSPINNYNVTVNIGKFAHFGDLYVSGADTLRLDYYVMPENLEKARKQFEQVKPMLRCFERFFGRYPFWRDGFKEVESPHLGMEHQSALAYGNRYVNGYRGTGSSEYGLTFDFIIVHEAAHEWWGNSVTSKDLADMWIHESFGAYAEAIYVECQWGYEAALTYVNGKKQNVRNVEPIIGVYGVNNEGSADMYDKGQLVLNTIRHVIANDSAWFTILKGIQSEFRHKTVTAEDIFGFINKGSGMNLTPIFNQYFRYPRIPVLEISLRKLGDKVEMTYYWQADDPAFSMPVLVSTRKGKQERILPTTAPQRMTLMGVDPRDFTVAVDKFYIDVRIRLTYAQPGAW